VPALTVDRVTRTFRAAERGRGLAGALRDLIRPLGPPRVAVDALSFSMEEGEAVALIGPNGAGKSTTVKLLTGILAPTAGQIRACGLDPFRDRARHVRQIGVVFGQRTQLWWDLAVIEALDLLAAMFDVPANVYRARLAHFDAVLGIGPLLQTPVRQLSLGERMRCELAAALLHEPRLLFLDEPTIGLDVAVKLRLRAFLAELRDAGKTTIVLTTHDLDDVRALCPRVLLVTGGRLVHDGPMDALVASLGGQRSVRVRLRTPLSEPERAALVDRLPVPVGRSEARDAFTLDIPLGDADAPAVLRTLLAMSTVADVRVEDPSVEQLVARFYESGS
jgi:ABC-2 type transport system ATP-binding protein